MYVLNFEFSLVIHYLILTMLFPSYRKSISDFNNLLLTCFIPCFFVHPEIILHHRKVNYSGY